jgi:hypothetical protein
MRTICAVLLLLLCAPARAAFTVPGFELVYTYPIETTLERPGLRQAAEVWPELIASAQKSLDIAQFYFAPSLSSDGPEMLQIRL